MGKQQTSPKGSVWAEVEDDPALSSAAKLAIATLQAAGKLPVGTNRIIDSGALQDPAAQTIAAGVGRFLKIEANQIIASNANFDEAVAKKLWSQIVTAKEGVFDKIKANMLAVGALDGQIITGATVQTSGPGRSRVVLDSNGIRLVSADGATDSFRVDARTGDIDITGRLMSKDEWSYSRLADIGVAGGGATKVRYGMGLVLNRSVAPLRYPGGIMLKQNERGELQTVVAPPASDFDVSGHLTIGNREIGWGGNAAAFSINGGKIDFQVNDRILEMYVGQAGISFQNALNDTRIVAQGQRGGAFFFAGDRHTTDNGVLADWDHWRISSVGGGRNLGFASGSNAGTYMWSKANGNYACINGDGFFTTGKTKRFSMHVPKMSEERGGAMLQHMATESPFDGIEYWNVVELDSKGEASWVLPDYVPAIASRRAPWCVFSSSDRGASSARLERGEDRFIAHVTGEPGASVSVLVKGARIVEIEGAAGGTCKWQDFGDGEAPWYTLDLGVEGAGPHKSGEIIW